MEEWTPPEPQNRSVLRILKKGSRPLTQATPQAASIPWKHCWLAVHLQGENHFHLVSIDWFVCGN